MSLPGINYKNTIKIGTVSLAVLGLMGGLKEAQAQQPNILYIMSDDHTRAAIGSYNMRLSTYAATENIDRLAAEGIRMNHCICTNAICGPSRACVLSGQYSGTNGFYGNGSRWDSSADNVAKQLQAAGYNTAIFGKWHLGTAPGSLPTGFDDFEILIGQGTYYGPEFIYNSGGARKTYEGVFVTDKIGDLCLNWLENTRDTDKPFFLMMQFKSPHDPRNYAERFAGLYDGVTIPEPESFFQDSPYYQNNRHLGVGSNGFGPTMGEECQRDDGLNNALEQFLNPAFETGPLDTSGMTEQERKSACYQKYLKDYLRSVAGVDDNIGRVIKYLETKGSLDNTLVIYTSDQGYSLGEHGFFDKRWMYEEPLNMPFVVRYPPEIAAGTVSDDFIRNIDFAPTFLDYANVKPPESMQGTSFRSVLAGHTPEDWMTSVYYRYWQNMSIHYIPAHYGIVNDRYKLIFYHGCWLGKSGWDERTQPGWDFFDLQKDPGELNNVYDYPVYADTISEMKAELLKLKDYYNDKDESYHELMDVRNKHWNNPDPPAGKAWKLACSAGSLTLPADGLSTMQITVEVNNRGGIKLTNPGGTGHYVHRINCGGQQYTDSLGATWAADRDFTGGAAGSISHEIYGVADNTEDETLYQHYRKGVKAYELEVPNGMYEVELYFMEPTYNSRAYRAFDIIIEEVQKLESFDIWQRAGRYAGLSFLFKDIEVTDGTLDINFKGSKRIINAIAVREAAPVSVKFTVSGAGRLIGDSIVAQSRGVATVILQSTKKAGKAVVTAESVTGDLVPGSVEVKMLGN